MANLLYPELYDIDIVEVAQEYYKVMYHVDVTLSLIHISVSSARFADGLPDTSQWTEGEDFVRADTGDDFSDAFDAVIMIEDVELEPEGRLRITGSPRVTPGMNIRGAGSAVRAGELLARAFLPLRPRDLAVLQMEMCIRDRRISGPSC